MPIKVRALRQKRNSPNLLHDILVLQEDTLPQRSYRIYGESHFCFQIAAINNLPTLTQVEAGQRLYFPPLEK